MTKKSLYKIHGKILDKTSGSGVKGLLIKAWDVDLAMNDLLGSAPTDRNGIFHMEFDESYFKEIFLDQNPDVYFEIHSKGKCIYSTQNEIICKLTPGIHEVDLEIDINSLEAKLSEHFVYPDPRQFTNILPDNPVSRGKNINTVSSGEWKEEIDSWWKNRKKERKKNGTLHVPKLPMPRPYLSCTSRFGPQLNQLTLNQAASLSFTVWNDGNFPAWTCYVELFEGPVGYNHPLSDYELRGRQIISLQPGERRDVALPWIQKRNRGRIVGVVFDPILDSKDFQLVEQYNRHITSIHYL